MLKNLRISGAPILIVFLLAGSWFGLRAQETVEDVWPIQIETAHGTVTIYQPQPDVFVGDTLRGRAAVSVTTDGMEGPVFGAIWFDARVSTDRENRLVTLDELNVGEVRFSDAMQGREEEIKSIIVEALNRWDATISLDRLLAALEMAERERAAASELKNDPPKVIFSNVPAVLVSIDGKPRLAQVEGSNLMRVVNTPFMIAYDPQGRTYYLREGADWLAAEDVKGEWKEITNVPESVNKLFAETLEQAETTDAPELTDKPRILVTTEPTELIVVDGDPEFQTVFGTDLLYVANTERDVFLDTRTQDMYVLLSGRWFRARTKEGPFTYVPSDALPLGFSKIPPNSIKANVLPFVAGTEEAKEAVLDAQVPQTAAVVREKAELTVQYDGEPQFAPIEGTRMEYAVNSAQQVVHVPPSYYCCDDGVWFEASTPQGPWTICTSVPSEIYTIPPSSPVYNVTYVRVYDWTPEVVYVGYTMGYLGCYVYGNSIVWGTGYWYPGWYGRYYYPWPHTYGCAAIYNPYTYYWGFGFYGSGGHVHHHHHHGHDHDDHDKRDHNNWWGRGGHRNSDWHRDWDRDRRLDEVWGRTRRYTRGPDGDVQTNEIQRRIDAEREARLDRLRARNLAEAQEDRRENIYGRRNDVVVDRKGRTAREIPRTQEAPRVQEMPRSQEPPTMQESPTQALERFRRESEARRKGRNDLLTDREGEVYRRSWDGWQKRENRDWQEGTRTDRQRQRELDLQRSSRDRGEFRMRRYQEYRDFEKSMGPSAPRIERGDRGRGEIQPGRAPSIDTGGGGQGGRGKR